MADFDLEKDIVKLKEREKELLEEKHQNEIAFGQQRAKFMELFKQKEDELNHMKEINRVLEVKNRECQEEVKKLMTRVDEVKSESTIMVVSKEDEIARLEQRHQDEAASFQHILKESVSQAFDKASSKYEQERGQWMLMEQELQELKAKLSAESESSTFSHLARSLQKRLNLLKKDQPEHLENSVVKAQEDIELLRSVVSPLEEEIRHLKNELQAKTEELSNYIKQTKATPVDNSVDVKKTKELSQSMQSERASRTDLEMYVTVLKIQKEVLHNDNNNLKTALNKTEGLLERENLRTDLLHERIASLEEALATKSELIALDDAHFTGLLQEDQLVQYNAYKEGDERRKELVQTLLGMEGGRTQWMDRLDGIKDLTASTSSSTSVSTDILDDSSQQQQQQDLLPTSTQLQPVEQQQQPFTFDDNSLSYETSSRQQQQQPSTQQQQQQQQHASTSTQQQQQNTADITLDWQSIQNEMDAARNKLPSQCVRCGELEGELKEARKLNQAEALSMGRLLDQERQAIGNMERYIRELETNLQTVMENSDSQISALKSKLQESERFMMTFREEFESGKRDLVDYLKSLRSDREQIQKELKRLQGENDSLVERHARKAQEMQEEVISLPNNLEDMQLMLLKYREDLITCRVSLEHCRETMGANAAFLKSRLEAEQQERLVMEDTLTQELSQLQNQLDLKRQMGEELERETGKRKEEEGRRVEAEEEVKKKEKMIEAQQFECKQLSSVKSKLEKTVRELNNKIHGLQVDLDNSEYVQRDFVKLSQTLQIQLEKIRAGETEVRWQHEDDVSQCSSCKVPFSHSVNKCHCRHCGHIFCTACLSKSVASGPSLRPSRVCDVCHTMLVKSATPFFSQDSSNRNNLSNHHES